MLCGAASTGSDSPKSVPVEPVASWSADLRMCADWAGLWWPSGLLGKRKSCSVVVVCMVYGELLSMANGVITIAMPGEAEGGFFRAAWPARLRA